MARTITLRIEIDDGQAGQTINALADGLGDLDSLAAGQVSESLLSVFLSADLAGRGIAAIADEIKNLISDAKQAVLEVEQVTANISTIANIDTTKVSRALFDLSTKVPQSAQKLGDGLYDIFSSVDATQEQALALLEKYSKGAVAAGTDTQNFGTAVTGVLNAYGKSLDDADHISDVFFNTIKRGVLTGEQLASNLGVVTQSAKNAGVNFDTLGALIAGITKEGGDAAQNINNLANLLQKLPVKEATDELEKMGISIKTADGDFRPILDVLTDLKTKLDTLPPALRAAKIQEIFPDAQARTGLLTVLSQLDFIKQASLENANAVGVTEEAYRKMSQTASAQFTLLYNSAIAFLAALSEWITKSQILGGVVGVLGGALQAMARNTGTVLALVAALGFLTLAYNAVTIAAGISGVVQSLSAFGASLSGTIFVIQNVIRAMFGLQTAFITTAEVAVAATGGWAALAIAVGAIIYAFSNTETAMDRANNVTLESINANAQSLQSYLNLQSELKNMVAASEDVNQAQTQSGDIHERLNAILGRLEPATEAYIRSLQNEGSQIAALSDEIDNNIELRKTVLEANIAASAAGILQARNEKASLAENSQERQKGINLFREQFEASSKNKDRMYELQQVTTLYSNKIVENNNEIIKLNQSIGEYELNLIKSAQGLQWTNAQLQEHLAKLGYATPEINILSAAYDRATNASKTAGDNIDKTTGAIDKQADAVFNLREELNKLTGAYQQNIDRAALDIIQNAKSRTEAQKLTKEKYQSDPDFKKSVDETRRFGETQRGFNDFVSPSPGAGAGRRSRSQSRSAPDASRALADRQLAEFNQAMRRLDDGMRRMIEEYADKYRISRQLAFAQIFSESSFKEDARSPFNKNVGDYAYGLTQQLPATASRVLKRKVTGAELQKNPKTALSAWGEYMTILFDRYGDWELAILAYHQGEGTVDKLVAATNKGKSGAGVIGKKGKAYLEKIRTLSGVSGGARFELAETAEARTLREIAETRERINQLIYEGGDANQRELDVLREYESNLKQIEKLVDQINESGLEDHLVLGLPDDPAQAKATLEKLQNFINLQKSLQSQFDQSKENLFALNSEFDEGLTDLEKFDRQLQILHDTGKLTAVDFELLADEIEKIRENLRKTADLEFARKIRAQARDASNALSQMTEDFRLQIEDFNGSDLTNFLRSIEDISGLQFDSGMLTSLKDLFATGSQIDVEKFTEYVRVWLTLMAELGIFDATKIDQVTNSLKKAAVGFNLFLDAKAKDRFDNFRKSLEQEISNLQDEIAIGSANDQLKIQSAALKDILALRERELNAVITINRAELELSRSMEISNNQIRARVLEHLAQQKTLNEAIADGIINTYEAVANRASAALDALNEKTKGFLSFLIEPAKAFQRNFLTNITRNIIDSIFPGLGSELTKTNNPIAGPIVDEQQKTNKILERIAATLGAGSSALPISSGGNIGSLGSLLGTLGIGSGGGFSGGGNRSGGSSPLSGPGGYGTRTGDIVKDIVQVFAGDKGRGDLLSNIKRLFSTGDGGIFAGRKNILTGQNSKLGGILGGAGDIASLIGGLIGGRAGQAISLAGTGLSIGAFFGPIGAVVGGIIGLFAGLFGDPKRKKDKQENLPALQKGFADAIKEFKDLIEQVRLLQVDPDSALAKGKEIRSQIASGFGIQFESKKYKKVAAQQIKDQLAQIDKVPDGLMEQLKSAAEIARGAADRSKRILPEFAGGVYFADYFKPNGLVPGIFDSKDDLLALISRGEMVLNPAQQQRIRSAAGQDVFAQAGIPNYPSASKSPQMATGGIAGSGITLKTESPTILFQPNVTFYAEGVTFDEKAEMWMSSDKGKRTQVKIIKKLKKSGDV